MNNFPPRTLEVCYVGVSEDEMLRIQLDKQLSVIKRQGFINAWSYHEIKAGKEWEPEIDKHLNTAQIIFLLISPDFMTSDYCYGVGLKRAIKRHEANEAHVIPIILRPTDWKHTPIGKLKPLPVNGKPVTRWSNRDEALLNVAQGIRDAIEELLRASTAISTTQQPFLSLSSKISKNTKGNILVVDDNLHFIEYLYDTLGMEGYCTFSEMDSSKVLDNILEQRPDLIILDLFMPFIDGLTLLERLRSVGNNIPIIVLTGGVSGRLVEEIKSLGADYVQKPSSRKEILAHIESHLKAS